MDLEGKENCISFSYLARVTIKEHFLIFYLLKMANRSASVLSRQALGLVNSLKSVSLNNSCLLVTIDL